MADIEDVDVAIVGGGLAGLSAALRLKDAQKKIVLFESEKHLGGRTLMKVDGSGNGYDREFGGGYVGASQNYIQYLLRRFDIKTFRQYLRKDYHWLFQYSDATRIERFPGDDPLCVPGNANGQFVLGSLDTLALDLRTYLPEPWKHPLAREFDEISVEQWIQQQRQQWDPKNPRPDKGMSPDTEDAFRSAIRCAFSLEPRDLSFFFFLYYSACAGSFAALVDVAGGEGAAEGTRLRFGTRNLVNALEASLGAGEIQHTRVRRIHHHADRAEVHTDNGVWRASRVIVAMSPPASSRIEFDPLLAQVQGGAARESLCTAMENCLGRTIKGFVRFKTPFWRSDERKLMGFLLSAGPKETCPVSWTLDNVWNPGSKDFTRFRNRPEFGPGSKRSPGFGVGQEPENPTYRLMTFIVGDSARYWADKLPRERAEAVIGQLARVYGFTDDDLFKPREPHANYEEEDWQPRCAQGTPAPAAMMPPRVLTQFGRALRDSVGVIHWAGSESAQEWCGYMDGAVESGFRAANELLR
jgi:monoamine oxidase